MNKINDSLMFWIHQGKYSSSWLLWLLLETANKISSHVVIIKEVQLQHNMKSIISLTTGHKPF